MVIYADVLLLVNFSMDVLTLYAAGRLTNKRMTKGRTIAASLVGSIIATVITIIENSSTFLGRLLSVLIALGSSVLMVRICFGKYTGIGRLLRDSVIIWGAGALLGGIMTAILSLGDTVPLNHSPSYPTVFLLCVVSVFMLLRLIITSKSQTSTEVTIFVREEQIKIPALCDSGSFASDPITGIPVIFVKSKAMPSTTSELYSDNCKLRLRMIPVNSLGGSRMMRGFIPDKVFVGENEVSAIIAVDVNEGSFKGFDGLIPAALCK